MKSRKSAGYTPLHYATRYYSTETVRLVLDAGADINAQDNHGYTALMLLVGAVNLTRFDEYAATLRLLIGVVGTGVQIVKQ